MPLVIRGPVGGGNRGGPFHSQNVEMAFFHTPGLKIVYPSTAYDAKGLIKSAIRDDNPVLFEEHKGLYRAPALREVLPDEDYVVPLGKARTVREGKDLTIVTYGAMVHKSVEAAETLSDEGVSVEVIDLRTLLPMDEEAIIGSVKRTGKLLVVHEDTRTGGIAGEIAMRVSEQAFEWLDGPILRVTAIDAPVPYSGSLEDYFLPQTDDVVKAARYLAGY
jgi:2-oxoisovalerate dehydrogenase E1 component beta subunit